jgi:hypothetical protein
MAFCIDSALPCFAAFGEQTANLLRDRFQPALTHSLVGDYVNGLIDSSLGSSWTRLYDSVSFLPPQLPIVSLKLPSVSILFTVNFMMRAGFEHGIHLTKRVIALKSIEA